MAAATLAYATKTPHSIILNATYDPTGTGATVNMAALQTACDAGPLKQLLLQYTDANCQGLGFVGGSSGTAGTKKLRIYRVTGSAALGTTLAGTAEASFVNASGLVITALPTAMVGTACTVSFELRCLNSAIR